MAALYIDSRGPYPSMAGVDAWDESRDATRYAGPWPVVAHPPCGPWGPLRHLSWKQDPALALLAVDQVRRFGGVLEHPAHSRLFRHCRLPFPGEFPDAFGGYTIEVSQCDFGHVARKMTWLYLVGVNQAALVFPSHREPTHWVAGGRSLVRKGSGGVRPPGIRACSAQQRRRTPPAFAAWLVSLSRLAARAPR